MEELLKWYWVIFVTPFTFGIIMAVVAAFSMGIDGDTDLDSDADINADIDSADIDHGSTSFKMLSILGIGKVPLSFIITSMALTFGGTGMVLNQVVGTWFATFAVPISFASMVFFTRYLAIGIGKIMPQTETYVVTSEDLIGRIGKLTINADEKFGQVRVSDDGGTIHSLKCRTIKGEIPINSNVLIIEFEDGFYVVEPAPNLGV